jgi:hypothetical protein
MEIDHKLRVFALLSSLLFLGACGQTDFVVNQPEDFWTQERQTTFVRGFKDAFKAQGRDWILHVHFHGRDWGVLRKMETQIELPQRVSHHLRLDEVQLKPEESALAIESDFQDTSILMSLIYRYSSAKKAARAIARLFRCENGASPTLHRTYLLGSAASHGVDELEEFSRLIHKSCGRKIDFALLGDAIGQPGPFPKTGFYGLDAGGHCLHFYQRQFGNLIQGAPLENCINVKVERVAHFGKEGLVRYPDRWAKRLLASLDLTRLPESLYRFLGTPDPEFN